MMLLTTDICIQDCLNYLHQCQSFADPWEDVQIATAIASEKANDFPTFNQNRAEIRRRCPDRYQKLL